MKRTWFLVLCAAIVSRAIVSLVHFYFGIQWVPWLPGPSLWSDYAFLYLPQLKLLASGALLYRDFAYSYTPLFLYSMLPFYELGGGYAAWIPIVAADVLTAPVIYLIVRKFSTEKVALVAGLGYAFSPVALVNEGYLWLSSQPMTLFILLSILLLRKDRPVLSALALAVAILFKQEALFVLPPILAYIVLKHRASLVKAASAFALTILAVLSPFLVLAPNDLLSHLAYSLLFGPGKSAPATPSTVVPAAPTSLVDACKTAQFPNLHFGAICGNIVSFPALAWYTNIGQLNAVAGFVVPFLLALLAVVLLVVRRAPNILEMASAYSCIVGLLLFSALVHGVFGYYFIPVYALLLASATNRRALLVGLIAVTLGAFSPEGALQYVIPISCLFAFVVIQDSASRALRV